jgi:hypothetical protein
VDHALRMQELERLQDLRSVALFAALHCTARRPLLQGRPGQATPLWRRLRSVPPSFPC